MTPKDKNAIKGALRRAFSRSDLHRQVEDLYRIEHQNPNQPRCKKWSWCANCGQVIPTWKTQVDHLFPVVPLDKTYLDMTIQEVVDRMWCDKYHLQVLCLTCHDNKTSLERASRPKRRKK